MFKLYERGRNKEVLTGENHNEYRTKLSFLTQEDHAGLQMKVGWRGQITYSDLECQEFRFTEGIGVQIRIDESFHWISPSDLCPIT
jgi:hypothetical protein